MSWGMTPWYLSGPDDDIDTLRDLIETTPTKYDVSFQLQLPTEWDRNLSDVVVGVTAGVETDRAHRSWGEACNSVARVIVPSAHAAKSLIAASANESLIRVVPESFTKVSVGKQTPIKLGLSDDAFGVLIVGQLTHGAPEADRKNIFNTIKWTREFLSADKNAAIVLKTNCGRNTAIDFTVIKNTFTKFISETCPTGPPVHILHGNISDTEMTSLYQSKSIKCLVSLTRGEGFGLPLLEAAASALPVIATDWSAHTEYLGSRWTRVSKTLVEIPKSRVDNTIFVPGAKWAEADKASYGQRLLKTRDSYRVPKEWAIELQRSITQTHSQDAIERAWDAATRDIL